MSVKTATTKREPVCLRCGLCLWTTTAKKRISKTIFWDVSYFAFHVGWFVGGNRCRARLHSAKVGFDAVFLGAFFSFFDVDQRSCVFAFRRVRVTYQYAYVQSNMDNDRGTIRILYLEWFPLQNVSCHFQENQTLTVVFHELRWRSFFHNELQAMHWIVLQSVRSVWKGEVARLHRDRMSASIKILLGPNVWCQEQFLNRCSEVAQSWMEKLFIVGQLLNWSREWERARWCQWDWENRAGDEEWTRRCRFCWPVSLHLLTFLVDTSEVLTSSEDRAVLDFQSCSWHGAQGLWQCLGIGWFCVTVVYVRVWQRQYWSILVKLCGRDQGEGTDRRTLCCSNTPCRPPILYVLLDFLSLSLWFIVVFLDCC